MHLYNSSRRIRLGRASSFCVGVVGVAFARDLVWEVNRGPSQIIAFWQLKVRAGVSSINNKSSSLAPRRRALRGASRT